MRKQEQGRLTELAAEKAHQEAIQAQLDISIKGKTAYTCYDLVHVMIKIFKEHSSKQCILDDFEFYEDRQRRIQENKAKQQQFQKQVWEGKTVGDEKRKEGTKVEITPPKSAEEIVKEAGSTVVPNGVANGS
ncbi:hypothetical protein L2E82_48818 [Cichorium intybus]|uniref:Uncharacterized protein n=1 Tax=Cichorium intybus TaxID=13427 RepID=A0ACB8YZ26_CICIN|nr:hypothetical protein L2E82_48818 [Cichorium intybus]